MNVYKGVPSKLYLFELSNEDKEQLTKDMLNKKKCYIEYKCKKYIICMHKTELLCSKFCCIGKKCKNFLGCILFGLIDRKELNKKFSKHDYYLREIEEYEIVFGEDENENI